MSDTQFPGQRLIRVFAKIRAGLPVLGDFFVNSLMPDQGIGLGPEWSADAAESGVTRRSAAITQVIVKETL